MRLILLIITLLISSLAISQTNWDNVIIHSNSVQDYHNSLIKQSSFYDRYKGNISRTDSNTFNFGDKVIFVTNTPEKLLSIFELGILYPDIFCCDEMVREDQKKFKDSDTAVIIIEYKGNSDFNSIFGNDSLTITDLRENSSLQYSYNIKRFYFLLFRKGFANPTEYYIMLGNDKANKHMDIETFIKGAKLIKIKRGSILI